MNEEQCEPDCDVESLVIQHVMTAPKGQDDDKWLRNNMFQTFGICYGKKCVFMIDFRSCENMVSTTMVSQLNLKCEDNSRPYKVSWFKRGDEVSVTKRCRVKFSIRKV